MEPLTSCQRSDATVIYNVLVANYRASFIKINFCETSFLIYQPTLNEQRRYPHIFKKDVASFEYILYDNILF